MSPKPFFLAIVLASTLARAEDQPLTTLPYTPSLDVPSMDRSVDPCTDFFAYSCGGWIRRNPIPPDQSQWNVYGKLYDENQRFLWGLLRQAASGSATRSVEEQKIGDYFAACMDEQAAERAGTRPLQEDLQAIDDMRSVSDLARLLGRLHLTLDSAEMLFGSGADQDRKDSTRVILYVAAGGLGLPDRDYYLADDDRSKEIREKYAAHLRTMFGLLGDPPARAAANEATVLEMETDLARASLTRVERRDPHKTYHPMSREALQAFDAPLRLGRLPPGVRHGRGEGPRGHAAGVPEGGGSGPRGPSSRGVEDLPALAPPERPRPLPVRGHRQGRLRLLPRRPVRGQGDAAALEALRLLRRPRPRGGARPRLRGPRLPSRDEAGHRGHGGSRSRRRWSGACGSCPG